MEKLIKQILIVVDFSDKSKAALENIIPIANEMEADVHLLHVKELFSGREIFNRSSKGRNSKNAEAMIRLRQLQADYVHLFNKQRYLFSHVEAGRMETVIRNYAIKNHIDLVMLTSSRPYPWSKLFGGINIDALARKIKCPVLNLPYPGNFKQIRNIVLPVSNPLPLRKIMFASYMAKYQDARIHLVCVQGKVDAAEDNRIMEKAYMLLKENTQLSVECYPADGSNIANSTLNYAVQINADLIVVEPGEETVLPGILNNVFSRFLFTASRIPVMSV